MTKFKMILTCLAILSLFPSCKNERRKKNIQTFSRTDFKETRSLTGISRELVNVFKPIKIKVIPEENLLLVLDRQGGKYFAHAYTLDSIHFIKSFITNGNGPDDQLFPSSLQYIKDERRLYVFDFLKQNLFYYSIDSIATPGLVVRPTGVAGSRNNKLVLNFNFSRFIDPVVIPGSHSVAGIRSNVKGEPIALLNFYDQNMGFKFSNGIFPDTSATYPFYAYQEIYIGGFQLSEEGDRLIYNYYNTDLINMFDTAGKLLASRQGPDQHDPSVKIKESSLGTSVIPDKNTYFCYLSPARMADKKLFLLYNGSPMSKKDESCGEMFEFDEELTPIARYKLSEKLNDFDIDWKARKMYGLTRKNIPRIVTFSF